MLSYRFTMDGFITIASLLILMLPLHLMARHHLGRLGTPAYLREVGVIILRPEALDACGDIIGMYAGAAIYSTVTFKGMIYEFERIADPDYKAYICRDELYLDPGLIYIAK